MAVTMKALRRIYVARTEYGPGQTFTVADDREADRLVRRSKAERIASKNPTDLPETSAPDELTAARRDYEATVGRRPYHGWDAAELRSRASSYRTTNMGDSALTTHLTPQD